MSDPLTLAKEFVRKMEESRMSATLTELTHEIETAVTDLPVRSISIDHNYQRATSQRRVERMVRSYDARLVGTLLVSARPDGTFVVIDGQHRLEMLRAIDEDAVVSCTVYNAMSIGEEAELFWRLNASRRAVSPAERFQARLVQGETKAHDILTAMTEVGVRLATYNQPNLTKNSTRSITMIEAVYDAGGREHLTRTLSVLRDAWGESEPDCFRDVHIRGMGAFFMRFPHANDDKMASKLGETSPIDVRRLSTSFSISARNDTGAGFGQALTHVYNKGMRADGNRLSWTA